MLMRWKMKKQYEEMVVIFLDILGSKAMSSFDEKYKIHKIFHSSVKWSQELQSTDAKSGVAYTRKLFSFSDCAYIFYRYKDGVSSDRKDKDRLLQVALFNTHLMLLELLNEGYLVRGGVSYGDAYYDELSFFGPAVEDAYLLESKKAINPRILLADDIGKTFYEHEIRIYSDVFSDKNPSYQFMPKRTFIPTIAVKDNDDYIINYFYLFEMENDIPVHGKNLTLETMKENMNTSLSIKLEENSGIESVVSKLKWMLECVNKAKYSVDDGNYKSHTFIL